MFQVMCERCFAVMDLPTQAPPEGCTECGSSARWVGPYIPESRIMGVELPESVPESPFYAGASAAPQEQLPADR